MPILPETIVAPPASTPPLHSLMASAVIIEEPAGSRWEGGFVFQPENCIEAESWNACGTPGEVDQIVVVGTSGTWTITFNGQTTAALQFDASAQDVREALEALSNVAVGDVVVSLVRDGSSSTFTLTWVGEWLGIEIGADLTAADVSLAGPGNGVVVTSPLYAVGEKIVKKDYDGNQEPVTFEPYMLEVPYTCSSWGFQDNDYAGRARRQMRAAMHKALEYEFWTGGSNTNNQSLKWGTPNDDDHVLNPGGAAAPTAVSPGTALVLLAQALANCGPGSRGMIHATAALVERLATIGAICCTNSKHLTTLGRGDIIVSGSGYDGTGPIGQPAPGANEAWIYATGMVNIRHGDIEIFPKELSEALDRSTNTVTFRGEVVASAVHDGCCTFAVLVDLCGGVAC